METIIGLLFVLLPVLFKFIEKKLQDSGKNVQIEDILMDVESATIIDEEDKDDEPEETIEVSPRPVVEFPKPPVEKAKPSLQKQDKKSSPILKEERNKKEKIDPKKLVIYSEIMKPKYQE